MRIKDVKLKSNLVYDERLVQILDWRIKQLRNKHIPLVKILQKNHQVKKVT